MKRGKKYIEAAKQIERGNLYEKADAIALVKKSAVAKFDEIIRPTSEQDVTDVTLISRSVELLFFRTEQVKLFVSLYLLKMQRLRKQKLQEQIS